MYKKIFYLFMITVFLFSPFLSYAEEEKKETSETVAEEYNPLRKIARGAVNTTLCWVEIPRQAVKVSKEKGDVAGIFWGPLKGLTYTAGRFCVGVYEVITFLVPPYKPVMKPEFIFSEEEEE